MPSGPAITLGLGPKIGPKGKRKRKGGRRCTHACLCCSCSGPRRGRNWALPFEPPRHTTTRRRVRGFKARVLELSRFGLLRIQNIRTISLSRERSFVCTSSSSDAICIDSSGTCGIDDDVWFMVWLRRSICLSCRLQAPTPCDRRARGYVHDHPSPPRAPDAPPRRHRRHVCRVPFTLQVKSLDFTRPGKSGRSRTGIHATAAPRRGRRRHRAPHTS